MALSARVSLSADFFPCQSRVCRLGWTGAFAMRSGVFVFAFGEGGDGKRQSAGLGVRAEGKKGMGVLERRRGGIAGQALRDYKVRQAGRRATCDVRRAAD